ncbi:hypothetical protein BPORC_1730 [Bifidobacterium porcinum]|nr:hypothetical protein BPORC_1730 [Bifidobacterium porcinum]
MTRCGKTAMKRSIITVFRPNRTSFTVQRRRDRRNTPSTATCRPRRAPCRRWSRQSRRPQQFRRYRTARRPDDGTTGRTAKFATRRYFCS